MIETKEQFINDFLEYAKNVYELFWLKAIVNNVHGNRVTVITFDKLINQMIYYAIPYAYDGKEKLNDSDLLALILKCAGETIDIDEVDEEGLIDYLQKCDNPTIKRAKECIGQEVPYRFLNLFADNLSLNAWKLPKEQLAKILNGKKEVLYHFGPIQGLNTNIYVYQDWGSFLKACNGIVNELIDKRIEYFIKLMNHSSAYIDYVYEIFEPEKANVVKAPKICEFVSDLYKKSDSKIKATPCILLLGNKLYKVRSWEDTFKIVLYYNFYKNKNINRNEIEYDIGRIIGDSRRPYIRVSIEEDDVYFKFADNLYVNVFKNDFNNLKELDYLKDAYNLEFKLFLVYSTVEIDEEEYLKLRNNEIEELIKKGLREKKTKYLIAHINGKVFSEAEKFYKRVGKEFDDKVLIGDILISEKESLILKEFMRNRIEGIVKNGRLPSINHEKVFAFGLVRYAMKNYQQGRFWPNFKSVYGIDIPVSKQGIINTTFKNIIKKYGKEYIETEGQEASIQNICMHAFVCDKCADQLFNYVFDFWRLDLSRSIENCNVDSEVNLFEILMDEVLRTDNAQVPDVMMHTTMALRANKRSSRLRLRRILYMIDNSYWNNTDYTKSKNRITILFNSWKNNPKGNFMKELKRDADGRSRGRGEKLLSKPTLTYNWNNTQFSILLPKQILRYCNEEERPIWKIKYSGKTEEIEPLLLAGKASLYSDRYQLSIENNDIFSEFSFVLESENRKYANYKIKEEEIRFFNAKGNLLNHENGYIQKEAVCAFSISDKNLEYIDGYFENADVTKDGIKRYSFKCENGQVFILPDGHAISIGKPLTEGIIGSYIVNGVIGEYNGCQYNISNKLDKLFFKCSKQKLNGSAIKIEANGKETANGRIKDYAYKEFKVEESIDDTYGYLINLSDYIKAEGCFTLTLDIPGFQKRKYSLCYIKDFNYEYLDAPYVFRDSGIFKIDSRFNVKTDKNWEIKSYYNQLVFSLDESNREEENDYVKDRKLHLEIGINGALINLKFDIPALYWKFKKDDEWSYSEPFIISSKEIPSRIYIEYSKKESISLFIDDSEEKEESLCYPCYDNEAKTYYFKTVDFSEHLSHDRDYRDLKITIGSLEYKFLKIACRSIVHSASVTGDFNRNIIYGSFDIEGNSSYMVQLLKDGVSIEQDIPVDNGCFEINCDVKEGKYTIILYELEEDDSGFGFVSYELKRFDQILANIDNLVDKKIIIDSIQDRKSKYARLYLNYHYEIRELRKLNYDNEVADIIDIHSWLYDSNDYELMSKFTYYKGILGCPISFGYKTISKVLLIFDDRVKADSILVYLLDEDEALEPIYDAKFRKIIASDEGLSKQTRKIYIKTIDDELYKLNITVAEGRKNEL